MSQAVRIALILIDALVGLNWLLVLVRSDGKPGDNARGPRPRSAYFEADLGRNFMKNSAFSAFGDSS